MRSSVDKAYRAIVAVVEQKRSGEKRATPVGVDKNERVGCSLRLKGKAGIGVPEAMTVDRLPFEQTLGLDGPAAAEAKGATGGAALDRLARRRA